MIWSLLGIGACAIAASAAAALPRQHRVPARFEAGRVFVDLPIEGGEALRMYTDSGGGGAIIFEQAARRLQLATTPAPPEMMRELGPGAAIATRPPRVCDPTLPGFPDRTLVSRAFPHVDPASVDGQLGQGWFAGAPGRGIIRTAR